MARGALFLPFPFRTAEDRIRLFSLLHVMRQEDYPAPPIAVSLMLMYDDRDLRKHVREIRDFVSQHGSDVTPQLRRQAVEALDTLSYFHGLSCNSRGGKCLGVEIETMISKFTT